MSNRERELRRMLGPADRQFPEAICVRFSHWYPGYEHIGSVRQEGDFVVYADKVPMVYEKEIRNEQSAFGRLVRER